MTREFKPSSRSLTWSLTRWALLANVVILGLGAGADSAQAADASFTVDFGNAYVWRGVVFNDSGVSQFSLDASGLNAGSVPIGFNVWGNYDIGDFEGSLDDYEFSEIDLTISAGLPHGFEVGFIEYQFPVTTGSTRELYVAWSRDMLVTPSVAFYYDIGAVDDFYASFDLTYSIPLSEELALDFNGLIGLAGGDFARVYGGNEGGFFNYNLSAAASYQVNETFGLQGMFAFSGSLDEDVLPDQPLGAYFLAGFNLAF